jgi:hypothetical protein
MLKKLKDAHNTVHVKKWDVIIIFVFVLLSFVPALLFRLNASAIEHDKIIVVEKDGVEIFSHLLDVDEAKKISFPFKHNGKTYEGELEIREGSVMLHRLPEEIVPLSIHEDMGWISEPYEIIVALPIKLIVKISTDQYNEIDVST